MAGEESIKVLFKELNCEDPEARYRSVNQVKHALIGNQVKKTELTVNGVIPIFVERLANGEEVIKLVVEIVTVLGSFARGPPESVQALVASNVVPLLLDGTVHEHQSVRVACLKTLCTLYQSGRAPSAVVYQDLRVVQCLVDCLQSGDKLLSKCAAVIVAESCHTVDHQNLLASAGILHALVGLLSVISTHDVSSSAAVVTALSVVVHRNPETARMVVDVLHAVETLSKMLSSGISSDVKLGVAACVTNLFRSEALPQASNVIALKVLPTLVKCCRKAMPIKTRIKALGLLGYLIEDSMTLQEMASYAERIISTLIANLEVKREREDLEGVRISEDTLEQLKESSLEVLAVLSTHSIDIRKRIFEQKELLMKHIVAFLNSEVLGLKTAALKCVLFWSRSAELLRTTLYDYEIWKLLNELLHLRDVQLLSLVSAAVCNHLLPVSASRENLIESGVLPKILLLLRHQSVSLQSNGVWAVMNLTHQTIEPKVEEWLRESKILDILLKLCAEAAVDVKMKAIGAVSNILAVSNKYSEEVALEYGNEVKRIATLGMGCGDNAVLFEQILILIHNFGNRNHKCKLMILEWEEFIRFLERSLKEKPSNEQILVPLVNILAMLTDPSAPHAVILACQNKLDDSVKYALQKCEVTASPELEPLIRNVLTNLTSSVS